jgi:hypothetical protein
MKERCSGICQKLNMSICRFPTIQIKCYRKYADKKQFFNRNQQESVKPNGRPMSHQNANKVQNCTHPWYVLKILSIKRLTHQLNYAT